jgi:hypothetical protein
MEGCIEAMETDGKRKYMCHITSISHHRRKQSNELNLQGRESRQCLTWQCAIHTQTRMLSGLILFYLKIDWWIE